jgi:hypothetical protein
MVSVSLSVTDKTIALVLDCVRERSPPFSPADVVDEFASILKTYRCAVVHGDKYGGEFPRELFQKRGVTYQPSERSKSEIYTEFLPLINSSGTSAMDSVSDWVLISLGWENGAGAGVRSEGLVPEFPTKGARQAALRRELRKHAELSHADGGEDYYLCTHLSDWAVSE